MSNEKKMLETLEKLFSYYVNDIGLNSTNAKMVRETLHDVKGYDPILDHQKKETA